MKAHSENSTWGCGAGDPQWPIQPVLNFKSVWRGKLLETRRIRWFAVQDCLWSLSVKKMLLQWHSSSWYLMEQTWRRFSKNCNSFPTKRMNNIVIQWNVICVLFIFCQSIISQLFRTWWQDSGSSIHATHWGLKWENMCIHSLKGWIHAIWIH